MLCYIVVCFISCFLSIYRYPYSNGYETITIRDNSAVNQPLSSHSRASSTFQISPFNFQFNIPPIYSQNKAQIYHLKCKFLSSFIGSILFCLLFDSSQIRVITFFEYSIYFFIIKTYKIEHAT